MEATEAPETFTNGETESTEDERRRLSKPTDFGLNVAWRTPFGHDELLAPHIARPSGRPRQNRERDMLPNRVRGSASVVHSDAGLRPAREQLSVARRASLFSVRAPLSPFLRL